MITAPAIRFDESQHRYWVNGIEYISVTQALDEGGYGEWKRYVDQLDLAHACDVGTATHRAIELHQEGSLDHGSLDPGIAARLVAYGQFLDDCDGYAVHTEQMVCNTLYGYAGRLDFNGMVLDSKAIVDFKSGGVVHHVVAMQLAAYCACMAGPQEYARYSLQLRDDGSYRLHEYPRADYRADFADFCAALMTAQRKRRHR